MMAGIFYGAMYGGSTTSILLNLPGEAASVVTCIDGYQMAKKGRAGAALGIAAIGSFVAGTVAVRRPDLLRPAAGRIRPRFRPPRIFRPDDAGTPAGRDPLRRFDRQRTDHPRLRPPPGDGGPRPDLGQDPLHLRKHRPPGRVRLRDPGDGGLRSRRDPLQPGIDDEDGDRHHEAREGLPDAQGLVGLQVGDLPGFASSGSSSGSSPAAAPSSRRSPPMPSKRSIPNIPKSSGRGQSRGWPDRSRRTTPRRAHRSSRSSPWGSRETPRSP